HLDELRSELAPWDLEKAISKPSQPHRFSTARGPLWLIKIGAEDQQNEKTLQHHGLLAASNYSRGRDLAGVISASIGKANYCRLSLHFVDWDEELALGLLVGIDLAAYRFQKILKGEWPQKLKYQLVREGGRVPSGLEKRAKHLAIATNLSRHLVNLPANWLNPKTYAEAIQRLLEPLEAFKVDFWDHSRITKEGIGFLDAVGKGAEFPPCLLHLSYRPKKSKIGKAPVAFVGKGITFDSGGLDIKPSRGMRLMKKDMGGSATLVGLAWWLGQAEMQVNCDFYFPLAENAISGASFRPGDIYYGRDGRAVEIHNTDAEGRLILADALDLAVNPLSKEKPFVLIDVATLTGAIKAALGSDIAGLFSNSDSLAEGILKASQEAGDLCWRMPLYQAYKTQLSSPVAECTNSVDGFGGAVTAALFLESYVGETRWAHLDIFSWKNKPEGAFMETGGSGQMVQTLARWLENLESGRIEVKAVSN
ncbi:MAG: leucyl aminopeptidase family protein, partial [Bdellovibrionales bacterium]|nr:leucyl aminopeptidase family protein [Bdellovibrionales bacterium]